MKSKVNPTKEGKKALVALKEAVADVIREHKLRKIPIAVWRHGQVVKITP